MEYFDFRAMNTMLVLAAEGEPADIAAGFEAARLSIETNAQRFTRFSDTSELSQMNRAQGEWFPASSDLFALVQEARGFYEQTGGLFDPAILPDLRRIGYDRSLEYLCTPEPGAQTPVERQYHPTIASLGFDEAVGSIWLPAGVEIDLGGIAKGWIAERALRILSRHARACAVSAGGDIVFFGLPEGQEHWTIGLEDPRDPQQNLANLKIDSGAIATSSVAKRHWTQGTAARHHIIDPRTGEPARSDWLSVTVIAPQATTAEVFAKCLLIAGADQAPAILAQNTQIHFIAVDQAGKLWGSQHSSEVIHVH
jgi:FAD:protein FMN transferase